MITHKEINKYYRCPMLLYLETHGSPSEKQIHPLIAFYRKNKREKVYTKDELERLVAEAFNAFSMQKETIKRAWISSEDLFAKIEKLEKRDGESLFGDYYYVPVYHRFSHSIRKPLLMEIVYKLYVLSLFQEKKVKFFVLKEEEKSTDHELDDELFDTLIKDLDEIKSIIEGKKKVNPSISQKCKICPWLQYCKKLAKDANDLSLVSGIGKKIKRELKAKGITNLKKLASIEVKSLFFENISENELEYFKLQATSLIEEKPIIREMIALSQCDREFFVDIEASAYHNLVWLIGCLIRENNKVKFISFVAHKKSKEKEMIKDFLNLVLADKKKSFIIYHWSSTERSYFAKAKQRYPDLAEDINRILPQFFDLFLVFKRHIILPVFSYTLKEVAKFLGFNWHEPLIDGATSITLFERWKKTKNPTLLKRAIAYNSDDCRALMIIKDYIAKTLSKK